MTKRYDIFLADKKIGTTALEKADAPMGVVFGEILDKLDDLDYDFIKKFCTTNNISLALDSPADKFISTTTISTLTVKNETGTIIQGIGNQISGSNEDGFEISLEGIAYPFYEEEFPHHVKAYNEMFK